MKTIDQTQLIPLINQLKKKKKISDSDIGRSLNVTPQYIREVLISKDHIYIKAKLKILNVLGIRAEVEKKIFINLDI
jgi:transcriptional regulator with XRE-family HTH domain